MSHALEFLCTCTCREKEECQGEGGADVTKALLCAISRPSVRIRTSVLLSSSASNSLARKLALCDQASDSSSSPCSPQPSLCPPLKVCNTFFCGGRNRPSEHQEQIFLQTAGRHVYILFIALGFIMIRQTTWQHCRGDSPLTPFGLLGAKTRKIEPTGQFYLHACMHTRRRPAHSKLLIRRQNYSYDRRSVARSRGRPCLILVLRRWPSNIA